MASMVILLSFLLSGNGIAATSQPSQVDLSPHTVVLEPNPSLEVKESIVSLHGEKFKRLEYKSEVFYLRLQNGEGMEQKKTEEMLLGCKHAENILDTQDARIIGEVKITKVASAFIEGMRTSCESYKPTRRDLGAGLKVKTGKNSDIKVKVVPGENGGSPKTEAVFDTSF